MIKKVTKWFTYKKQEGEQRHICTLTSLNIMLVGLFSHYTLVPIEDCIHFFCSLNSYIPTTFTFLCLSHKKFSFLQLNNSNLTVDYFPQLVAASSSAWAFSRWMKITWSHAIKGETESFWLGCCILLPSHENSCHSSLEYIQLINFIVFELHFTLLCWTNTKIVFCFPEHMFAFYSPAFYFQFK